MARIGVFNLGAAVGITGAIYALFLGVVAWLFGWGTALVTTLSSYYVGFSATLLGSLIGAVWVLVDGFIAGVLIAVFYNLLQNR